MKKRISKGCSARAAQTLAPRVAQSFYKIDRIHSFDIRHSKFMIRYSPMDKASEP